MLRCAAILLSLLLASPAIANDTTARVGTGGITFLQNSDIRMAEEELTLSSKQIRVRYRFENDSDHSVETTIAFPMPAYSWNPGFTALDANNMPMSSFSALVDGKPVATTRERRAMLDKRDITTALREAGLDDSQIFDNFANATPDGHGLDDAQAERLTRLGALQDKLPTWQVAETRTWQQHFPAKTSLRIEHEYQPMVGTVYDAPYQKGFGAFTRLPIPNSDNPSAAPAEACVDEGTRQAAERRIKTLIKGGAKIIWVTLEDVEYILGTGRNWKGPIGRFTLRLEKQSPDQLVSLCFPGKPKREGDKTLVFQQHDYTPQDKLVVYFYTIRGE
ncbi:MAG: DUF4424 family protein [Aeromonadaceae bacterium]|nr:DUF4424 family protein [Aeromonadaceae bacterium]